LLLQNCEIRKTSPIVEKRSGIIETEMGNETNKAKQEENIVQLFVELSGLLDCWIYDF